MTKRPTSAQLVELYERLMERHGDLESCLDAIFEAGVRHAAGLGLLSFRKTQPGGRMETERRIALPVLEAVALRYNVRVSELSGASVLKVISWPRFVAMWLLRSGDPGRERMSFPSIGRVLGGRDHSTIVAGVHVVERRRAEDPALAADLDALRDSLRAASAREAA